MCNAHNHSPGCDCGFGPQYQSASITVVDIASPNNRETSQAATLSIKYSTAASVFPELPGEAGKADLAAALALPIQEFADQHFGVGKIIVKLADVRRGSLTITAIVCVAVGGVWKFFVEYEQLRKGIKLFRDDLFANRKPLFDKIRTIYLREVERWRPRK